MPVVFRQRQRGEDRGVWRPLCTFLRLSRGHRQAIEDLERAHARERSASAGAADDGPDGGDGAQGAASEEGKADGLARQLDEAVAARQQLRDEATASFLVRRCRALVACYCQGRVCVVWSG